MLNFASLLNVYGMSSQNGCSGWADVLQSMPCWLWETDADYVLRYLSEGLELHSTLKREDLAGVCILDEAWGKGEEEAGLKAYHDALRSQEPINGMVYERLLLTGERAVLMDSALPMSTRDGDFLGYRGITFHLSHAIAAAGRKAGIVADLKTRADALESLLRQRNRDLEHSNTLMKEILEAMGEGLLVTSGSELYDDSNRILFVNPALLEQFGYSEGEIYPGRPVSALVDVLGSRGDITPGINSTIEQALGDAGEINLRLPSQSRNIRVKGSRRPGGGYVLVHSDVTELEARNAMLDRARREADIANAAKSNFLAAMSHEIRTPMNGIVGMTDLLSDMSLTPEQAECIDTIRTSAQALTALISDILDFSKVEAGHLELVEEPFDLITVVRDVSALMRPMAEAKGLTLVSDVAPELPRNYQGDSARLRQVLLNLLGNAIKFTMEGNVTLRVRDGHPLRIDVADTGIGIPSDKIDQVFAPFEQAQGGLQRQFEGTGLGLAISQQLVAGMGGDISLKSMVGQGTVFTITLPLEVSVHSPEEVAAEREAIADAVNLSGRRVLVAEDNRTNQIVVRKMLERVGAQVEIAGDGEAAYWRVQEQAFDLILMDLSMPRMSGIDATKKIRQFENSENRNPVPIIALTGNAFEKDRKNALEVGMNDFLTKPVRMDDLHICLARHESIGMAAEPASGEEDDKRSA